jgi:sec-independent protein translocase protein TatA
MGTLSIWHWLVVALVVLLLFGRGKISDMMGDVAKGIKAFKKGIAEEPTPQAGAPTTTPQQSVADAAAGQSGGPAAPAAAPPQPPRA